LGDCYHSKGQSVQACKCYNNAFDIAFKSKNYVLESDIYNRLENLYFDLGDVTEVKRILLKSVALDKKYSSGERLIRDYTELARATDDTFYIKQALFLSDSLHIDNNKLRIKNILFAIYMTKLKDSKKALNYLNSQSDLKENVMRGGIANYYFTLGEIYRYANNPDSALFYFKLAEPSLFKTYDAGNAKYVFSEMAVCYELKKDTKNAIYYYEKTLEYCKGDLSSIVSISNSLSGLYKETGNFEKAFNYKMDATSKQDSLTQLSKDKDIALLDVARETRKHEVVVEQEEEDSRNARNLQYMAITIAISIVFSCGQVLIVN
jgi:tetratricopeptide (TPR) repeat protein